MLSQMGIRELRDNLTATIRRVRAGETIEITHHRERVAVLAPPRIDRIDRLHEASDVTPGVPLAAPLRRHPVTGALTASEALEEDRAER
ncbi:MAG TPA: type II toxin-antitoxin system prevent-host-death family antitoxin [Solirubrobacteraceae bacterium]|jgi:prevent-host-death family protein|nr:type II toxin-antitoxin system prevent-host-death family antitoxin [Solirubrobacteraceae bacterium]